MIEKLIDTIVAVSTSRGSSGIGIIRVSGSKSLFIASHISKKNIKSDVVQRSSFFGRNNVLLDFGIILYFSKPRSFTGEDVVEFHAHGNDLILDSLLLRIIELGARLAEPGEFSFRAFFYGKIDLLQAESINSLIKSKFLFHNTFILKSLSGSFSKKINIILDELLKLRQDLEACIEFPDDISFDFNLFFVKFDSIKILFNKLFDSLYIDYFISDTFNVVLLGDVNVGKSSFFNTLLKKNRAIVSSLPGTTRDFIEGDLNMDDIKFKLVDTAGFNTSTTCFIEKTGISNTFEQLDKASIIIYMFDTNKISDPFECDIFKDIFKRYYSKKKFFVLKNKIDLLSCREKVVFHKNYVEFFISVKKNIGIDLFLNEFKKILSDVKNDSYMINKRHYNLFLKVKANIDNVNYCNGQLLSLDICVENLKNAYLCLSEILGKQVSKDVMNEIFSNFCVGK